MLGTQPCTCGFTRRREVPFSMLTKALRPGPSGNEAAPNHANYDEALAKSLDDVMDAIDASAKKPSSRVSPAGSVPNVTR